MYPINCKAHTDSKSGDGSTVYIVCVRITNVYLFCHNLYYYVCTSVCPHVSNCPAIVCAITVPLYAAMAIAYFSRYVLYGLANEEHIHTDAEYTELLTQCPKCPYRCGSVVLFRCRGHAGRTRYSAASATATAMRKHMAFTIALAGKVNRLNSATYILCA